MKFKIGDQVIVTAGKDKGKKGEITSILKTREEVVVKGANYYVKHHKPVPMIGRAGDKVRQERALSTAKVAIINDRGEADRIGYQIQKDGQKVRIFKKTQQVIVSKPATTTKKETASVAKTKDMAETKPAAAKKTVTKTKNK